MCVREECGCEGGREECVRKECGREECGCEGGREECV